MVRMLLLVMLDNLQIVSQLIPVVVTKMREILVELADSTVPDDSLGPLEGNIFVQWTFVTNLLKNSLWVHFTVEQIRMKPKLECSM